MSGNLPLQTSGSTFSVEATIRSHLNRATLMLAAILLALNVLSFLSDVRRTTEDFYQLFQNQMESVARANSMNGDFLSLQRQLEAMATPFSNQFPVQMQVSRDYDQKTFIDITSPLFAQYSWFGSVFEKKTVSYRDVAPFGVLRTEIHFDLTTTLWIAFLKAVLAYAVLLVVVTFARWYLLRYNRRTLSTVDDFTARLIERLDKLTRESIDAEADRRIAKIAAQVSHDIRSPLGAIKAAITTPGTSPAQSKLLLLNAVQRITAIADELLLQHRTENGRKHDQALKLTDLLQAIVDEKRAEISGHSAVEIKTDLPIGIQVPTSLQPLDLARILSNLMNNAVEAIEGAGLMTVSLRDYHDCVLISVMDTGRGISREQLATLRTGQYRSSKGNGLGLTHARDTVTAAGGKLDILSDIGRGTVISITLPKQMSSSAYAAGTGDLPSSPESGVGLANPAPGSAKVHMLRASNISH